MRCVRSCEVVVTRLDLPGGEKEGVRRESLAMGGVESVEYAVDESDRRERTGNLLHPSALLPAPTIAACAYLLQIIPRLKKDGPLWFTHLGSTLLHAASTSSVISPSLGATSRIGYDGQFYFAVAADPAHAHDYIRPFVPPGIVYSRGLYPALARLFGLGSVGGIAYALLLINLVAILVAMFAIGDWLRRRRVSPAYALLYGLFPGVVFCVFRDLTEPLAFAFAALAIWLFDRRTPRAVGGAAVLMGCAMLTRETTGVFAASLALALIAADRQSLQGLKRFRRGLYFLAASTAPVLLWRLAVTLWIGGSTQEHAGGLGYLVVPFSAYIAWWPWQPMRLLIVVSVVVPTLLASAALLAWWKERGEQWPLIAFFLNAVVFVAYLPKPVLVDYGAAGEPRWVPRWHSSTACRRCAAILWRRAPSHSHGRRSGTSPAPWHWGCRPSGR